MSLIKYGTNNSRVKDELFTHFDYILDEIMNNNFPKLTDDLSHDFFTKGSFPKVNVLKTKDCFVIQAAVAGYNKDDISIQLNNNLLTISGKSSNSSAKDIEYFFREVKLSNFSRTFKLSGSMNIDKMNASVDNGLLTIKIPLFNKQESSKIRSIKID
jgi:HSP20 family protein